MKEFLLAEVMNQQIQFNKQNTIKKHPFHRFYVIKKKNNK